MSMGIYTITNTRNGKVYVGGTSNLRVRIARHKRDLKKGIHRNRYLQKAFNRHGANAFEYQVVEPVSIKDELLSREQAWIEILESDVRKRGYNLVNQRERRTHSSLTKARMSRSQKGKKISEEHRAKLIAAIRRRYPQSGTKEPVVKKPRVYPRASAETKLKMSMAHKGVSKSPEHRAKIGEAHRGRKLSPEHRQKLLEAIRNRSPETRTKLSKSIGKLSDEQVIEIKARLKAGQSVRELSQDFGVSRTSIYDILKGRTYKRIP